MARSDASNQALQTVLEYVCRSGADCLLLQPDGLCFLLTPFKLITVFLHEASHAIACKLTCGQVEGIQVQANEGGSTQTRGGIYWVILSAGYLGSSFCGMALILASTNLITARMITAAGCFIVALIVVLFIAKNWTLQEFKQICHWRPKITFPVLPCLGELLVEEHRSNYGELWAGGRDVFELLAQVTQLRPDSQRCISSHAL